MNDEGVYEGIHKKSPNRAHVKLLLKSTFPNRHREIARMDKEGVGMMSSILLDWPCFGYGEYVSIHSRIFWNLNACTIIMNLPECMCIAYIVIMILIQFYDEFQTLQEMKMIISKTDKEMEKMMILEMMIPKKAVKAKVSEM